MSITITDPVLLAEIARADGTVDVLDAGGTRIARIERVADGMLPPGVKSPFTAEQIQELRKQRDGRPLADILRDLEARA